MSQGMPKALLSVLRWNRSGGLEATTVEIGRTFREAGWSVDVVAAFDHVGHTWEGISSQPLAPRNRVARSFHFRGLWKHRLRSLMASRGDAYDLIVLGHAHLLPAMPLRLSDSAVWLWTYGIEVWGDELRPIADRLPDLKRVVAISDFTAGQVARWANPVPISVVPCFVDEQVFVPATDRSGIRRSEVLICGRMSGTERYKGHETLFRSLRRAERLCGRPLSITVIGDGDDRPRLERLAFDLGIAEAVRFRGRVPLTDLVEAYQKCGVFAMPSYVEERAGARWSGEGFGIVYAEAAACGRPVIASAEGGARETISDGETGLLVDPRSEESVAQAIAEILGDPERADAMGEAGRRLVEERFCRDRFRRDVDRLVELDIGARNGFHF
jgi:phosphatidyl-myo-inositol dimannoside synthase